MPKTTHGMSYSPEYAVWRTMRARCVNPNVKSYAKYGARGITISDEWRDSFEAFYKDIGPRPGPGMTLERIDNAKGYCKGNCRWATRTEQARNTRGNVYLEYNGELRQLCEWAELKGMRREALWARLKRGMTLDEALNTPLKYHGKALSARKQSLPTTVHNAEPLSD